jgi:glycosyltransferase involved in cell wall biosynthesis
MQMRVLQLGKYWRKPGGIETHVKTLCKTLAVAGVNVVNLVSSINHKSDSFQRDGYTVVESPQLGVLFSTSIAPRMLTDARRLHAEKAFDLIHLHFPEPMSHLVSLALPAHIPRVITWHSDIVKQRRVLKLYKPFQTLEINRSKAIVAATRTHFTSSTQIPSNYPDSQKHVIPFGIDFDWLELTPYLADKAKSIRSQARGKFVVFALGRQVRYKGFDVLLNALQHTVAYLILGGEGPLTSQLKDQAQKLGISDRVVFTGKLSEEDAAACYHACDVFCLPSVTPNEAFGIVQVEAMACGKPVICTKLNNGVNEINPHMQTGLTVSPSDPIALSKAINQLRDNPTLATSLGRTAQQHARNKFSTENMITQYLALYEKVIKTAPH